MPFLSYQKGDFAVYTDPAKLDVVAIHGYLSRAYWSEGIPRDIVEKAIANSCASGYFTVKTRLGWRE